MRPGDWRTLGELLRSRADGAPELEGFKFLRGMHQTEVVGTYATLERRARAIGAVLQRSVEPGDRALIQCPPGLDYIAAFFGCVLAGVIAAPIPPPVRTGSRGRLGTMVRNATPDQTDHHEPRRRRRARGRPRRHPRNARGGEDRRRHRTGRRRRRLAGSERAPRRGGVSPVHLRLHDGSARCLRHAREPGAQPPRDPRALYLLGHDGRRLVAAAPP